MQEKTLYLNSKVLDSLILDRDCPEAVVEFMKSIGVDEVLCAFSRSHYWKRVFQLDFFAKLSCESQLYFFTWFFTKTKKRRAKTLDHIHEFKMQVNYLLAILSWQMMRTKSRKIDSFKIFNKKMMEEVISSSQFRHPYSVYSTIVSESEIRDFDDELLEASLRDEFPETIRDWSQERYNRYLQIFRKSIFYFRFLQYDVFETFNLTRRWQMMQKIENVSAFEDFALSILDSAEDVGTKREFLKRYQKIEWTYDADDPMLKYLDEKNFSRAYIRMSVDGLIDLRPIIEEKLRRGEIDFLMDWVEKDEEEFNMIFNCSELVRAIYEENQMRRLKKAA